MGANSVQSHGSSVQASTDIQFAIGDAMPSGSGNGGATSTTADTGQADVSPAALIGNSSSPQSLGKDADTSPKAEESRQVSPSEQACEESQWTQHDKINLFVAAAVFTLMA